MKQRLNFSRLSGGHKKDCWLFPNLAMWLVAGLIAATSGYAGITSTVFEYMFKTQPTPYLDEVFHIPQARKYCDGNFTEWDSKITTLPGLYLLSVGFLKPIAWALSKPNLCLSVYALRSMNICMSTGMVYVVYNLLRHIHGYKDEVELMRGLLTALNVCIFPVFYFFNFLYYTDVASTFLVLLAYLLCLQHRHLLSAGIGFVAVLVRQTNIVWVAFFGLLTLADVLKDHANVNKKKFTLSVLRSYRFVELLWTNSLQVALVNSAVGKGLVLSLWRHITGYLIVGLAFLSFLLYNGGLVVGDKEAHQAALHLPQLLYFSLFVLVFMFPMALPQLFTLHHTLRRNAIAVLLLAAVMFLVVYFNTLAHPYLLADNRHYTFYLWRRVINRNSYSRFLLIPGYILGAFLIGSILKRSHFIFQVGFSFCLAASTVPQTLLEFRYFIIPYVFLRLQISKPEVWQLLAEMGIHLLFNATTIILYSMRTIYWPDLEEPQRFLW